MFFAYPNPRQPLAQIMQAVKKKKKELNNTTEFLIREFRKQKKKDEMHNRVNQCNQAGPP